MFYPTLPEDTQDFGQVLSGVGRSLRDISRGVSYYPYDLLGSGVDVANLALGAVGLGSERPVLGSDYLRNIARSLGMAQEPTGSATENITRLAAGFTNPMAGARAVGRVGEITTEQANRAADALVRQITGNPEATAPAVLEAAGGMVPLAGVMNVTGLPNMGRDIIQSSAEDLSSKLRQLGFQADVTHSGSAAGPSSYVRLYDPQTGRYFANPFRFSGHSKGAFNQAEVTDISDPTLDLPKIIEAALAMRAQGPGKIFQFEAQRQAIADELIASGMKPRKAYREAYERLVGEPQAGAKGFNVVQPGDKVSGLTVRKDVPNMSSISASLDDYEILSGIREVPRSAFDEEYLGSLSYDKLDKRTKDLVEQIKQSKEINPMIVGVDSKGAYIIEGGHRFDALMSQDTKSIPAVVVIDKSDPPADIGSLLD